MPPKIEKILLNLHCINPNISSNFDEAVDWLFDSKNKYIIFSEFETILNYNVQSIDEFKENVDFLFNSPNYMHLPPKIAKQLSSFEISAIQQLVSHDLVDHYSEELSKFMVIFNHSKTLAQELEFTQTQLESFVNPPPKKHNP